MDPAKHRDTGSTSSRFTNQVQAEIQFFSPGSGSEDESGIGQRTIKQRPIETDLDRGGRGGKPRLDSMGKRHSAYVAIITVMHLVGDRSVGAGFTRHQEI